MKSRATWLVTFGLAGAAFSFRVATEFNDVAGILTGVGFAALIGTVFVLSTRRMHRRDFRGSGPVNAKAMLDLSSLPGHWPVTARETLGALGGSSNPGMPVTVTTHERDLVIEKRKVWGTGRRYPFVVRIRLRAIRDLTVDKPRLGAFGSCLRVEFENDGEIRLDIAQGHGSAEDLVGRLRASIAAAPRISYETIVDLHADRRPPVRTSPTWAYGSLMIVMPPWVASMLGFYNGRAAGSVLSAVGFVALTGMLFRPRWLPLIVGAGLLVGGAAFAIDGLLLLQPIRFLGTAGCIALGIWLFQLYRSGRTSTGPAT